MKVTSSVRGMTTRRLSFIDAASSLARKPCDERRRLATAPNRGDDERRAALHGVGGSTR